MKIRVKLAVLIFAAAAAAALFFFLRSPVLIVSDEPFSALYGKKRILAGQLRHSAVLGRRVKQVMVADGAGDDVLVFAVEEAASRPWCVIFPNRYAGGARRYSDQFPQTPVVLLTGRVDPDGQESVEREFFFRFSTDTELDFYRAGLCAGALGGAGDGPIAALLDLRAPQVQRDSFARGLREQGTEKEPLFPVVANQLSSGEAPAAVLVAGGGAEYLGNSPRSPLVLFTWLEPALTSRETAVVFDDSPWAQAAAAVRMVKEKQKNGKIPSKVLIFPDRVADNGVLQVLKKAAQAVPEKNAIPDGNDLTKKR